VRPVVAEVEDGRLGADALRLVDESDTSISYVTAAVNLTMPPADLGDPPCAAARPSSPAPPACW
jgi:hypothetical protein